jgi:uncharacterized protein
VTAPFHLMAKPAGPRCNMACRYCFYTEKAALFGDDPAPRMSDAVLASYIRETAAATTGPVQFAFQGGEPTLAGLDFFRRALDLAREACGSRDFTIALQTNGRLLDDPWCAFLAANPFLVGLSLDGPRELHDANRVDRAGAPCFDEVVAALLRMKARGVQFNVLTTVNAANVRRPIEVYRFIRGLGVRHLQFIPIVEREPDDAARALGLDLGAPGIAGPPGAVRLTPWSVSAGAFGEFLIAVFDEWIRRDVGRVFVQAFDSALANRMGAGGSVCQFAPECGRSLVVEKNGDVYACDHYVYPSYRRGNLLDRPLAEMVDDPAQVEFGRGKADKLPAACRCCEVLFLCNGDCPKHRLLLDEGEPPDRPRSILCDGYRRFFNHILPHVDAMAELLRSGRQASEIMARFRPAPVPAAAPSAEAPRPGRNAPCPCGSGRKFKQCCGR